MAYILSACLIDKLLTGSVMSTHEVKLQCEIQLACFRKQNAWCPGCLAYSQNQSSVRIYSTICKPGQKYSQEVSRWYPSVAMLRQVGTMTDQTEYQQDKRKFQCLSFTISQGFSCLRSCLTILARHEESQCGGASCMNRSM